VAQAGIDWGFMDHWILNASVAWADIGTEATLKGTHDVSLYDDDQVLPIFHGNQRFEIQVDDLDIDPWIYRVNVGYRF
jgi:outer membrane protein W